MGVWTPPCSASVSSVSRPREMGLTWPVLGPIQPPRVFRSAASVRHRGDAMRQLDGEQMMVRVFLGEDDRWHGQLLHVALIERFRKEGIAGATVFRGISGYGA